MTKRQELAVKQATELQRAGYAIDGKRSIRLHSNPQEETTLHAHAKMAAGQVLARAGYRIDSEVEHEPTGNVADIVAYGLAERRPIIVELESVCDRALKLTNVDKYQHGPVSEVHTFDLSTFATDVDELQDQIKWELGL